MEDNQSCGFMRPVVAVHQPNFIPWAGFFHKMLMADFFVYLDNVPYTKNGFQNRNRIWGKMGEMWLTVPVLTKGRLAQPTSEVMINEQVNWRKKHLGTLLQCYAKSPAFNRLFPEIEQIYSQPIDRLVDFNRMLLDWICLTLDIKTPCIVASGLGEMSGATDRLVAIVHSFGGRTYLSGLGGKNYLDESVFRQHGIHLCYQAFNPLPYRDPMEPAMFHLSILDVLFNMGTATARQWIRGEKT